MTSQNVSTAVMARRVEPPDSLDFFPTPAWATRALMEHVLKPEFSPNFPLDLSVWEPACGDGAMARPLFEYFGTVYASDIHEYGFGQVGDFLDSGLARRWEPPERPDFIVTNPPFRLGVEFAERAIAEATLGVCLLLRSVWIEGVERHAFFNRYPLTFLAPFAERVPMVKGRLDRKASTATAYSWFVWLHGDGDERLRRIPPCRKQLDFDSDWPVP